MAGHRVSWSIPLEPGPALYTWKWQVEITPVKEAFAKNREEPRRPRKENTDLKKFCLRN